MRTLMRLRLLKALGIITAILRNNPLRYGSASPIFTACSQNNLWSDAAQMKALKFYFGP